MRLEEVRLEGKRKERNYVCLSQWPLFEVRKMVSVPIYQRPKQEMRGRGESNEKWLASLFVLFVRREEVRLEGRETRGGARAKGMKGEKERTREMRRLAIGVVFALAVAARGFGLEGGGQAATAEKVFPDQLMVTADKILVLEEPAFYPAVDAHTHLEASEEAFALAVKSMDAAGVAVSVNLAGGEAPGGR